MSASALPPPKFQPGELVKHLKTGGLYEIIGLGRYEPAGERLPVYVYRSQQDQRIWVRPQSEMEDGRFELADAPQTLDVPMVVFTDGACKGNPGRGGWGVLLQLGETSRELCGGEGHTTNNRMELTAAIKGLQALPANCLVELHTDSQYVQKGVTEWLPGWKRKNWVRAGGGAVVNKDLWLQLDAETSKRRVTWKWVRGHNGHPGNEAADRLANQGAAGGSKPVERKPPRSETGS